MSVRVMTEVWALQLPDSQKIVLLALADSANDEGHCWPSMMSLSRKCSKGQRTVQGVIKTLVDAGHVTRRERAGHGCDYWVHPRQPEQMQGYQPPEIHYVYRTTNETTGEFYVGARSCLSSPDEDAYLGSGTWVKDQISSGSELNKVIVEVYPSREALAVGEAVHTAAVFGKPGCMNKKVATPSTLTRPFTPAAAAPRKGCTPQPSRPAGSAPRSRRGAPPQPLRDTPAAAADKPSENHQEPSEGSRPDGDPALSNAEILDGWNDLASRCGLATVVKLTEMRKRKAKAQGRRFTIDEWLSVFRRIEQSPFLRGTNDRGWRCDFDFILSEGNFTKILEGKYDRQQAN